MIVGKIPKDLIEIIEHIVLEEKHMLARSVLMRIRRLGISASESCLCDATELWSAIVRLGCYDAQIVRAARRHHDMWYSELEDPYEMRFEFHRLLGIFQDTLAHVLHVVVSKNEISS
jgi:hypothetical protein